MTLSRHYRMLCAALCAAALAWSASLARAGDPPTRVGRIVLVEGAVSLHPQSGDQWMIAEVNYPLTQPASLWTEQGARAEIEIGHARIDLDSDSELQVNLVDDDTVELTLPQGRIDIHLGHRRGDERYEVTTPRGTVALEEDGFYAIVAGTDQAPTRITAFSGHAVLALGDSGLTINAGERQDVARVDPLESAMQPPVPDGFDQWSLNRNQIYATSFTPQYVSPEVTGYEDLQVYGAWWSVPERGVVWVPRQVPANWAPYGVGHWRWLLPWGWTWIDDQPWGFAPFHYGRWVNIAGAWGWSPGPAVTNDQPAYAPALVSFVALPDATPEAAPIAWVPLAPGELYLPTIAAANSDAGPGLVGVSFAYFARLNPGARREALAAFEQDGAFRSRPPPDGSVPVLANQRFVTAVNREAFAAARPVQNGIAVPPPSAALRPVTTFATIYPPPAPVTPLINPVGPPIAAPPPRLPPLPSSAPARAASERKETTGAIAPATVPPPAAALQPQFPPTQAALPPPAAALQPPQAPPPQPRKARQAAQPRPDPPPPDPQRRSDPDSRQGEPPHR